MAYRHGSHSKCSLRVHLIFVTKYRLQILRPLANTILDAILTVLNDLQASVVAVQIMDEHLHLLVEYSPVVSVLQIVKRLKQQTTFAIWQQHKNYISTKLWKERTLWSDGYFAASVGDVSTETIQRYLENQG